MISEAEFSPMELIKTPLLPNLDFKLRKGNSLLQKFGTLDFTFEDLLKGKNKSTGAARKLNDFVKRKKEFIVNQFESNTTYLKLKQDEHHVFLQFIDELILEKDIRLHNIGKQAKQQTIFAEPEQKEIDLYAEEKEKLKFEIEQLKKLRKDIHKEKVLPFSYDFDFMEIFLTSDDPGFDLIIGNPPYVRQEQILPPEDGQYLEYLLIPENKDEKAKVNKEYKEELSAKVYKSYPFLGSKIKREIDGKNKTIPVYGTKVPGRSDLYCYFQLLCPNYLNSKGTFCFIISNSWLDVEFGGFIQQFLLKHTSIHAVYDCNVRSFDAGINTIIYLHSSIRNLPKQLRSDKSFGLVEPIENEVKFIMNKIDYTLSSYAPLLLEQEYSKNNTFRDLYRVISITQQDLFLSGYDEEAYQFGGDKWGGKYLRAPEIYYTILERGINKLVKLKDVAEVRRGITSGANEFFILKRAKAKEWKIEKEFLVPVLKSPRECSTIQVDPLCLPNLLFYCHKEKKELIGSNALKYIKWGEESEIVNGIETRAFNKRPSTRGRKRWWDVGKRKISDTVFPCGFGDSFRIYLNKKAYIDKRLYEVDFYDIDFNSSLNTTLTPLFLEVCSRTGLGDGLLDITVYEAQNILILKKDLKFNISRKIDSIFSEFGFNPQIDVREQEPNPLPDRKKLDDMVFNELGLTQKEKNEIYWSVAELVKLRFDKAASR